MGFNLFHFLIMTLNLSVPLVLAAQAAMIAERSGVICLGVEGMMLFGALFGAIGSYVTGNALAGILTAIIAGVAAGALYGLFAVLLRGQQVVVGVAINFFASGMTPLICQKVFGKEGASALVNSLPSIPLGNGNTLSPLVPVTVVLVLLIWFFIQKTKFGLRLRMTGDFPLGIQTCGISTTRYKMGAMLVCGALAGLGGAYLSVVYGNLFVTEMVAGRGYMGIAANIFGGWTPLGGALAALFFAAIQSLRYTLTNIQIPTQIMQMLPYAVTVIALVLFGRNSKSPEGLGQL